MSESLETQINQRMKDAMRAKDRKTTTLMRMIKSKVIEEKTRPKFDGQDGDVLWLKIITSYVKSSKKVLDEYRALGEVGAEHGDQIEWEIQSLEDYLPKKASEEKTRQWILEAIEACGGLDKAQVGPVMGQLMRAHKAEIDPQLAKKVAADLLG
jgi:hypothetical protein